MLNQYDVVGLHVELTSRCNLTCPHCARTDIRTGGKIESLPMANLSLDAFRSTLSQFNKLEVLHCCGNYGDITSYHDIFTFLDISKEYDVGMIRLYTNGSARTPEYWSRLAKSLRIQDEVVFSIDGLEDTNPIYRRGSSWKIIMKNLESFITSGGSAVWEMLVFSHNEHQVDAVKSLATSMGVKEFRIKKADRFDVVDTSSIQKSSSSKFHSINPSTEKVSCRYKAQKWLFLSFEAELLPCCWMGGGKYKLNQSKNALVGKLLESDLNVSTSTVGEILTSKFYIDLQESWESDNPLSVCKSKCMSSSSTEDKYIRSIEKACL